ncbi:MAG: HAMP domain-containing sensor histidine kinase [Actinomycetota bacterium]
MVAVQGGLSSWLSAGAICLGFGICYGLTGLFGTQSVTPTWYTPLVLVSAARFRYRGALVSSAVATILAGPLWPVTDGSLRQRSTLWVGRGLVFLFVGLVTAALIDRIIAGRKRELELAEQERDLAVRQAAVIATVSHEFRTPLTVITGVARTLEVHRMVSTEGVPLLSGLLDAARRLTDLVNTVGAVLDGSDDETFVRLEPVVLRDVMEHVLDHLGIRDPRNRVSVHIDANAEIFISDRELLSQLLRHVMENAVKFSPTDEQVEVRVHRERGRMEIRVADRGPGIDESLLRSPMPFTQGDRSMTRTTQGLGLGLFAASRLAAVLDGTIRFEARPGGGTAAIVEVAAPDTSHQSADGVPGSAIA